MVWWRVLVFSDGLISSLYDPNGCFFRLGLVYVLVGTWYESYTWHVYIYIYIAPILLSAGTWPVEKLTLEHLWPRSDKYSAKVFRYFVEYSEKESTKKSRVESHQQTSTGEACHVRAKHIHVSVLNECILWIYVIPGLWKIDNGFGSGDFNVSKLIL